MPAHAYDELYEYAMECPCVDKRCPHNQATELLLIFDDYSNIIIENDNLLDKVEKLEEEVKDLKDALGER